MKTASANQLTYTVVCPRHGETRRVNRWPFEGTGPLWAYLVCGHYYSPTFKQFRNPNQL